MAQERTEEISWTWQDTPVRLAMDVVGEGPTVLMLPAPSSISTRREMRPLQEQLADGFRTVAVDWPGFGELPRPALPWSPAAYRAFLSHLLDRVVPGPHATIAAGHGAGYLAAQAAAMPGSAGRLSLIAPTWRGPLPTMAGKRHGWFGGIARAGDISGLGSLLYRLNVNRPVISMMVRGHVYADPAWLDAGRLRGKLAVTAAPGARHASIRFVTGELDPMGSREEFLAAVDRIRDPMLVVFGADTPRRSRAEMEALAARPNLRALRLPHGKLAVHEEFAADVAQALRPFLEA